MFSVDRSEIFVGCLVRLKVSICLMSPWFSQSSRLGCRFQRPHAAGTVLSRSILAVRRYLAKPVVGRGLLESRDAADLKCYERKLGASSIRTTTGAIEAHQHLDPNGSGTDYSPIIDPNIGVERLTSISRWAEANGAKLFPDETGVPKPAR